MWRPLRVFLEESRAEQLRLHDENRMMLLRDVEAIVAALYLRQLNTHYRLCCQG
jgi:hypothetical protein